MGSSVKSKIKYIKNYVGKNLVMLLSFVAMNIVYIFTCLINFADMKVDWTKIESSEFWVNFALLNLLGIVVFVFAVAFGKAKQKTQPRITDLLQVLAIQKSYLEDECLTTAFEEYLVNRNKEEKLKAYQERLKFKICFALSKKRKEKYTQLLESTNIDNIENARFKKKDILTPDLIFGGLPSKKEHGKKVVYTGREGLSKTIVPSLLGSIIFQGIILSITFSGKKANIDTMIQLIAQFGVMLRYTLRGISFGDSSISETYCAVLENRKGVVTNFLAERGINIVIKENENYKYRIEEVTK